MKKIDITVVLGSKNRKRLLKATIESIRNNGFPGQIEIIVIDGDRMMEVVIGSPSKKMFLPLSNLIIK